MGNHAADKLVSPLEPAESPAVIAHLNMLHAVVLRMDSNSAQCKTWCLAIVSALFGFAGATKNSRILDAAIIPIVIFAFIDATYLARERAYRYLFHNTVAKLHNGSYNLSDCFTAGARGGWRQYLRAILSWSLWPVYVGLIAAYALAQLSGLPCASLHNLVLNF